MRQQELAVLLGMPMDSMARTQAYLCFILACVMVACFGGLSPKAAIADPKLSEGASSALSDVRVKSRLEQVHEEPSLVLQSFLLGSTADKRSATNPVALQALSDADDAPDNAVTGSDSDLRRYAFLEPLACPDLAEATVYTIKDKCSLTKAANSWGVPLKRLLSLNPELSANSMLCEGQSIVVEARTARSPVPYSRGKASRGSLRNACIMPEGEGYFLRTYRPNSWGTTLTVQSLVAALGHYAKTYPGGPLVNVGDLSKRRGGRIRPHASHQSGRDVDLGFIHKGVTKQKHPEHFTRATVDNLDVEKTWAVIEALIRTGNVDVIYIDKFVQKALYQHVKDQLEPEQLEAIFSLPRHAASSSAKLQHWPGHRNHAHVRFRCPDGQVSCK